MKFQFFAALALLLTTQIGSSAAFIPGNTRISHASTSLTSTPRSTSSVALHALPTPEESAKALTAYMAKAHEEKIKALKNLEDKKNGEIAALQSQVDTNTSSSSDKSTSVVLSTPASGDVEVLSNRLVAYQKFMAEYMINAQEDKARAVKVAEIAVAKKYEEKLNAFMLNPATGSSDVDVAVDVAVADAVAVEVSTLYEERNAHIAASAKAGKSRWGDKEVEKAGAKAPPSKLITPTAAIASSSATGVVPDEVVAADHGLRADGGVGGLSLAERVMNGAAAPTSTDAVTDTDTVTTLSNPDYEKRNAKIAACAKAGAQSRWGIMEVEKAIEHSGKALPAAKAANIVVLPEVEAADHGLRADGGVSGPSLSDRVNLGARLLQQ